MTTPSPPRDSDEPTTARLGSGGATATKTVDISDLIDDGRWAGLQKLVLVLAALAVIP